MVKLKLLFFAIIIFLCVDSMKADVKPSVKTNFTTGWADIYNTSLWYTSSVTHLKADSVDDGSAIKAFFDASISIFSMPETSYSTAGFVGTISLNKSYAKIRIPWTDSAAMRLSCGRMPLAWGNGLFYNAGDIIFGADPQELFSSSKCFMPFTTVRLKNEPLNYSMDKSGKSISTLFSTFGLSDIRAMTDWMFVLNIPFSTKFYSELVALPPIDVMLDSSFGRFGGRLVYQGNTKLLSSIESGAILQGNANNLRTYFSFAGTLWLDYSLSSSAFFQFDKSSYFDKNSWNISNTFFKSFKIRSDIFTHSLSERLETLWYPLSDKLSLMNFISFTTTEKTNVKFLTLAKFDYVNTILDFKLTCWLCYSWNPIPTIQLSLQGLIQCTDPSELSCVVWSAEYKY